MLEQFVVYNGMQCLKYLIIQCLITQCLIIAMQCLRVYKYIYFFTMELFFITDTIKRGAMEILDRNKRYSLEEALAILTKTVYTRFAECIYTIRKVYIHNSQNVYTRFAKCIYTIRNLTMCIVNCI